MAANQSLALAAPDKLRSIMRSPEIFQRFAEVLGQHNASAYISSVLLAVSGNDQLQQCQVSSIITAAMRAATLRLSCDPALKQAHLVPFKGRAVLVVGYKGFYDMAQRTGKYRVLNNYRVFEGQTVVEDQLRGTIEIQGHRASDTVIGYGFYFEMLNGLKKVLYMTNEEIEAHGKKYSKTYNLPTSLWKTNFEAMAQKTVTRLCLSRYGYLDPNDILALSAVDEVEAVDGEYAEIEQPRRSINQNLRELGFEEEPTPEHEHEINADPETGEIIEPEYADEDEFREGEEPVKSKLPPLRYQPEQLRSRIAETAKTITTPLTNGKKGLVATTLEACLSQNTDPKAARKQLMVYLIGKDSLDKASDAEVMALYRWLSPTKNEASGEWLANPMAEREAVAAYQQIIENK